MERRGKYSPVYQRKCRYSASVSRLEEACVMCVSVTSEWSKQADFLASIPSHVQLFSLADLFSVRPTVVCARSLARSLSSLVRCVRPSTVVRSFVRSRARATSWISRGEEEEAYRSQAATPTDRPTAWLPKTTSLDRRGRKQGRKEGSKDLLVRPRARRT